MKNNEDLIKDSKKYYIILSIITFICACIVSMLNLYNKVVGFAIMLIPNLLYNFIWSWYQSKKKD